MTGFYGWLTDYDNGTRIREATREEMEKTEAVLASAVPGAYAGAWRDDDGRVVYVELP